MIEETQETNERQVGDWRPLPAAARCPDCGAPWEPICPSAGCPGRHTPLRIMATEEETGTTKTYGVQKRVRMRFLNARLATGGYRGHVLDRQTGLTLCGRAVFGEREEMPFRIQLVACDMCKGRVETARRDVPSRKAA